MKKLKEFSKLQKHEMIKQLVKEMENVEEVYPELTNTMEFEKLNCYRVEGHNSDTGRRYTKNDLIELRERLDNKKIALIFS